MAPAQSNRAGSLLLTGLQERSLLTGFGHDFSGVRPLNSEQCDRFETELSLLAGSKPWYARLTAFRLQAAGC